jgi:hypothetical protein
VLVSKISSAGTELWGQEFNNLSGSTSLDFSYSIAVDGAGNVYTTGGFTGTVDFDPGPASYLLAPTGSNSGFVSKLTQAGFMDLSRLAVSRPANSAPRPDGPEGQGMDNGMNTGLIRRAGSFSRQVTFASDHGAPVVAGNAPGDLQLGGGHNNMLPESSGRSVLIADLGRSNIIGDSGEWASGGDILIGCSTIDDTMTLANELALMSILAEWQSADGYAIRFADINYVGGPNGANTLNYDSTVRCLIGKV